MIKKILICILLAIILFQDTLLANSDQPNISFPNLPVAVPDMINTNMKSDIIKNETVEKREEKR